VFPLQLSTEPGFAVLLYSLLALGAFAAVGAAIGHDAKSRRMTNPGAWGIATFAALFFGTVYAGLFGAIGAGLLVTGLYVAVRE
jgi:hypothetical protein